MIWQRPCIALANALHPSSRGLVFLLRRRPGVSMAPTVTARITLGLETPKTLGCQNPQNARKSGGKIHDMDINHCKSIICIQKFMIVHVK